MYLREHPVEKDLNNLPQSDIQGYVKRWFWELHNWVNESLGRSEFPYEQLASTYRGKDIRKYLNTLDIPMKRAIRQRSGHLIAYSDFVKQVTIFLSFY